MSKVPIYIGSVFWPMAMRYLITIKYSDGSERKTFRIGDWISYNECVVIGELPDTYEMELKQINELTQRRLKCLTILN